MNARNNLKTIVLMGIDTHFVYHAHRINKEWGWGLSKKQTVFGVVAIQIQIQGWFSSTLAEIGLNKNSSFSKEKKLFILFTQRIHINIVLY